MLNTLLFLAMSQFNVNLFPVFESKEQGKSVDQEFAKAVHTTSAAPHLNSWTRGKGPAQTRKTAV